VIYLTRHQCVDGPRWAIDDRLLPANVTLGALLGLPQAKVYNGSCALGPGIILSGTDALRHLSIRMTVARDGRVVFKGDTSTSQMARSFEALVGFLGRELTFPQGALLMTGTGIVPPPDFSMQAGDRVCVEIGPLTLENTVEQ
jgi:2-dehydro-3-deoxy-D-arabinonate dehydratase